MTDYTPHFLINCSLMVCMCECICMYNMYVCMYVSPYSKTNLCSVITKSVYVWMYVCHLYFGPLIFCVSSVLDPVTKQNPLVY